MTLDNLIRKNVKNMSAYSSARDEFNADEENFLFLDANENPFNTDYNRYPDPYQHELKSAISEIKQIPKENIVLGNGSDEVLDLIFRAFCEPKEDEIITMPPTYGMYEVLANLNDIKTVAVPLKKGFQIDVDSVISSITQSTKLIFICSPNNPSGNLLQINDIKIILEKSPGLVVIDEAYIDFAANSSFISELNDYPNLIITQTFSKALAHAGIRVGMCFASERIISVLNKIKPPYNINQLSQKKALEVVQNYETYLFQVEIIKSEREILKEEFKNISWIEHIYPSESNFLLCKVDNANYRYNKLLEQKIVVRNRTNQHLCENCLRFTVGTPEQNQTLLKVLKQLNS
ncbi:histidinol-phosphate transaminase [Psychroflexus lacisalsi]|jgi:histidinol-phosphate aminotransferase|uniref:Histidinol-phosphate aminotransferase n=1 Tax=Psychroflexus lacisalsi TaxID=503928 RepID=A0ABN1K9Q5_9FLAO|nr:histidinol-phosphate transaminase [Psychroflexus lacisalsi]MBZ9619869.1 histidinol-phosphate transaminase [Psychroflexus lacisalsi]